MSDQGTLFKECAHDRTIDTPQASGPHYAKRTCCDCGKFLGWIPKPATLERQRKNAEILTALSKQPDLSPYERFFVRDLATHKNISPRQQATLLDLRDKYLKGIFPT